MQLQELSPSLLKQKEILTLLTRCSIRRGSPQNSASLAIYVQDLSSYSLEVIEPVLETFGGEVPEEYKPLWPAVGVFTEMLRGHIRSSRTPEPTSGEKWLQYVERCKSEGIEKPDDETLTRIEKLNGRFGLEKPKEIITTCTDLVCPGCGLAQPVAGNIRLWTPEQLHEHANLLEELAVIAERNRNIPRLPLGNVVEEVA